MNEGDEKTPQGVQGRTLDGLLSARPGTLTIAHAEACLPWLEIDPEWQAAQASGSARQRLGAGSMRMAWPEERLSRDEADWLLAMREHCSWRTLASFVTGDGNQITGMFLEEAAESALADDKAGVSQTPA